MDQTLSLRQEMSVRMIPEQIVASMILRMNAEELRNHLEEELENNPALDLRETVADTTTPFTCPFPTTPVLETPSRWRERASDDEESNLTADLPAHETLRDHLWRQFVTVSLPEERAVGRYLIECIDDNGYLSVPLLEVAEELGKSLDAVEAVLHIIQALDPPGVGARDLRECLLLQLRAGNWTEHRDAALAGEILERGWDLLVRQDFEAMSRHLGYSEQRIQEGYAFIRRYLVPYPGRGVRPPWEMNAQEAPLIPDVCVRRTSAGYRVEVTDIDLQASSLCINREYQNICRAMQRGKGTFSEDERSHVQEALERARFLLKGLARRARTLQRVTEYVIAQQRAFVEGDAQALRPLTRRDVALQMGLSESTVCRATIGKCVELPSGSIVPFEVFFDVAGAIKRRIEALLRAEDPAAPLRDDDIADRLRADGIDIARRTVSKYREELGVPAYAERRRRYRASR